MISDTLKFFLAVSFLLAVPFVNAAPSVLDFELNGGEVCSGVKVVSKNQFGISIFDHLDAKTGKDIVRYIPFSDMTTNSLRLFPYCDTKSIDRLARALTDRRDLIFKRFKNEISECRKQNDLFACFNAPMGISQLRVFVQVEEVYENGFVGLAFSDAQEALFFGYVFVYGVKAKPGTLWTDTIYPNSAESKTVRKNKIYPSYTIFAPPRPSILDEKAEKEDGKRMGTPPPGGGGKRAFPPQGGKGGSAKVPPAGLR